MYESTVDPETGETIENEIFKSLFSRIETTKQNDSSIKEEIKRALRGQRYTKYIQLAYTIENGKKNPFASGNYAECSLGCFPRFTYFGKTYANICINNICQQGKLPNESKFCDSSLGNDVYMHYLSFWCEDIPEPTLLCGVGAHCAQESDGTFFCDGDDATDTLGSAGSSVKYVVKVQGNAGGKFMVAAYQNGRLIAQRPISNMSAGEYVKRNGPLRASQAGYYAQRTGLTTLANASVQPTVAGSNIGPVVTGGTVRPSGSIGSSVRNTGYYYNGYPVISAARRSVTTATGRYVPRASTARSYYTLRTGGGASGGSAGTARVITTRAATPASRLGAVRIATRTASPTRRLATSTRSTISTARTMRTSRPAGTAGRTVVTTRAATRVTRGLA